MKPAAGEEKFKLQGAKPPPTVIGNVISANGGFKPTLTFSISNFKVKNVENGLTLILGGVSIYFQHFLLISRNPLNSRNFS